MRVAHDPADHRRHRRADRIHQLQAQATGMTDRTEFELAAEQAFAEQPQAPESLESIGVTLLNEFSRAEADRLLTEQRWLRDLRQYKEQAGPVAEVACGH